MTRFLLSLIVILLIGFSCNSAQKEQEKREEIIENTLRSFESKLLNAHLDSIFSKYDFNGSIAVFRDSLTLYRKSSGYADFKRHLPIDSATVFAIASNSKQFISVLILQLEQQGKIESDKPVSAYLKEFDTPEYREVTISQLMNHTSGYAGRGLRLKSKEEDPFHYSNEGYDALGRLIEEVSGKSLTENLMELFDQAGLSHTYASSLFDEDDFAGAYLGSSAENASEVPDMPGRLNGKAVGLAAGGILSNVDDLHLWQQKLFSGELLDSARLGKMLTPTALRRGGTFAPSGYGYGLMMNPGSPAAYFHTGYVKGAPSLTIYYPETRTSVIILSNLADETRPRRLTFAPHSEIKRTLDLIQQTVNEMRTELLERN